MGADTSQLADGGEAPEGPRERALAGGAASDAAPHAAPSDELRPLYEERARLQYADVQPLPDPLLDRKFERTIALVEGLLPCGDYLDAGCGNGAYLAAVGRLARPPRRLVGVDLAQRILDTAAATCAAHGVTAELVQGNLERLPLADASFDVVLCAQAIEHVLEPDVALAELARVLRPGGQLVLTTLNRRMLVSEALNLPRTVAVRLLRMQGRRTPVAFPELRFDRADLTRRVRQAGLAVEHDETFRFHLRAPLDPPPLVRALNALERRLPAHGVGDVLAVVARRSG